MATRLEKPSKDVLKECDYLFSNDKVVFLGRDEKGSLAVDLQFRRGKKKSSFQYEHECIIYDQQSGWMRLKGNGKHRNMVREVISIPPSDFFTVEGSPLEGMHFESVRNRFLMSVAPFQKIVELEANQSECWMGSSPATLEWNDRMLVGRVICEAFFLTDFNALLRKFKRKKGGRQILSLSVNRRGDLHLYRRSTPSNELLAGNPGGIGWLNNAKGPLQAMELRVVHTESGMGLFRWPSAWEGAFVLGGTSYTFDVMVSDRLVETYRITGGKALGVIQGTLRSKKGNADLFGLAEIQV